MENGQHFHPSLGPRTPVNEATSPNCGASLTKLIQVHHHYNGNAHHHHPQCQSQAIENVYYWYDGNVPFCTDATACRPLDDNFLPMNVHGYGYGYWYTDKTQWASHNEVIAVCFCQQFIRLIIR